MAAVHPDDVGLIRRRWQQIVISGEPGEMEARIRRHDGEYRWFLLRAVPRHDQTGKIVNWYGSNIF